MLLLLVPLAGHGLGLGLLVGLTALGGLIAVPVGMLDLVWGPHGPERRAVAAAEEAVEAFERADAEEVRRIRPAASQALHQAWTSFRHSVGEGPLTPAAAEIFERIGILQTRYTRRSAELVDPALGGAEAQPWGNAEGDDWAEPVFRPDFEPEQLRDSSLGRPDAAYLLRNGLHGPSEVWLIAIRVGVATLLAGAVALFSGAAHPYWAIAFAALVLHQGGTRQAQTVRGVQRLLGSCWHPQVSRARRAFGRASEPLQAINAHPVTRPRSAADIHADVLAVQDVITDWR
ncbi:FUSC family protein [Enemella dayhoffiae]|uniref:hypothetical protein n=1 Tax=Enemella dayhoffiae TaxID=2016507 RepID=UPI0011401AC9|nr:hypothetical protein [Enemella dayhoffiae]